MRNHWERAPLEEAVFLQEGPGIRKYEYQKGGYPIINVRGVQDGYIDLSTCVAANVDLATGKWKHFQVNEGDILFTISGSIGRTARVKKEHLPLLMNTSVVRFRSKTARLSDEFFFYYLQSQDFLSRLHAQASGTAQKNVGPTHLKSLDVPLPPHAEQQRIVGILDAAFDGIAQAQAAAKQNLQNACALFESHLQSVFTQRGEGWVDTTIGEQIRFIDYRGKTPEKTTSGLRLITAKNVKMGYVQLEPQEFVAPESYDSWMTRGIPRFGDVLFTTEAPLANVAQLDTDEKVVFAQRIIIMQPDTSKLDSTFLKYLLLSQPVQQRIRTKGTGATVQGIKASLLKTIEISFPSSLDEQVTIVAKLDALREETQRLESLYQRKLAALDELKQSLLHQAFSGAL